MVVSEHPRVFYILDSLPEHLSAMDEGEKLQNILLKHFEGSIFEDGRITTHHVPVPHQPNLIDCGCFTIYFAKKFLADPLATMSIIKVILLAISLTKLN